jgi:hypothetical protein
VPTTSLILAWAVISAIGLIYVANATAYYGITSACTVTLIISYAYPLLINVVWEFQHCSVPRGVFTLGRYHRPLAIVVLVYLSYHFLMFPNLLSSHALKHELCAIGYWVWVHCGNGKLVCVWEIKVVYIGVTHGVSGSPQ